MSSGRPPTKREAAEIWESIRSQEWRSMQLPRVEAWATDEGRPSLVVRFHRPSYNEIAPAPRVVTPEGLLWTVTPRERTRFGEGGEEPVFGVETKRNKTKVVLHGALHCHPSGDRAELDVTTGHVPRSHSSIRIKLR